MKINKIVAFAVAALALGVLAYAYMERNTVEFDYYTNFPLPMVIVTPKVDEAEQEVLEEIANDSESTELEDIEEDLNVDSLEEDLNLDGLDEEIDNLEI